MRLQKLEPLFPPADQVQSLSLRAVLLRFLEQVKKNGYLGRDAVIRKTMLDECKGDRLEEVLATFSFAVVRNVLSDRAEETGEYPALAQTLAMENRGYAGERTELAVLKLAHQVVLSKGLREKNDARELYRDFSDLLGLKGRSIARRREQVKAAREKGEAASVTDDEKLDVWRLVRNNWAGNERWMETLLYGDANMRRDGLLSTPFDKVWRRVQAGRLSELDDRGSGLMEQLDSRVRLQQDRLRKWEGFRKTMIGDASARKNTTAANQSTPREGLGLNFTDHQSLHVGQASPRKKTSKTLETVSLTPEYANLIASFENELSKPKQPKTASVTAFLPKMPAPSKERVSAESFLSASTDVISELEDLDEDIPPPIEPVAPPVVTRLPQRRPSHRPTRSQKLAGERLPRPETTSDPEAEKPRGIRTSRPPPPVAPSENYVSPPASPTRAPKPYLRERSPTKELIARQSSQLGYPEPKIESYSTRDTEPAHDEAPKSPTQQQADDILASMSNASPSPAKPAKPRYTLSLDERTRLSMAGPSRSKLPDDEEDTLPLRKPKPLAPAPEPMREDDRDLEYEDIVARTRRSMVGFDAARQKAQLERRRSARKSRREGSQFYKAAEQFPRVEEEDHEDSALAEELMGAEQSYENVFMSRPRIQASPIPSPTGGLEELEE